MLEHRHITPHPGMNIALYGDRNPPLAFLFVNRATSEDTDGEKWSCHSAVNFKSLLCCVFVAHDLRELDNFEGTIIFGDDNLWSVRSPWTGETPVPPLAEPQTRQAASLREIRRWLWWSRLLRQRGRASRRFLSDLLRGHARRV
jgi:hypothetical protein